MRVENTEIGSHQLEIVLVTMGMEDIRQRDKEEERAEWNPKITNI